MGKNFELVCHSTSDGRIRYLEPRLLKAMVEDFMHDLENPRNVRRLAHRAIDLAWTCVSCHYEGSALLICDSMCRVIYDEEYSLVREADARYWRDNLSLEPEAIQLSVIVNIICEYDEQWREMRYITEEVLETYDDIRNLRLE